MSRIPSKNTGPEMKVRRMLHEAGFRYRLHRRDLPGTPDIVLPKWNAVIEVQGCFWHAHDCHLFVRPEQNSAFWSEKHEKNRSRDERNARRLAELGWRRLIVWECAVEGRDRLEGAELMLRLVNWIQGGAAEGQIRGEGRKQS
jgi:DNA mismatch endonuclease (patch repair protein)